MLNYTLDLSICMLLHRAAWLVITGFDVSVLCSIEWKKHLLLVKILRRKTSTVSQDVCITFKILLCNSGGKNYLETASSLQWNCNTVK